MLSFIWELVQAAMLLVGIGIYVHWLAYLVAIGYRKGAAKVPTNVNINFIKDEKAKK